MSDHSNNWTPEERELLTQELLELHFGCHEQPEALEARLQNEPELRALQSEVLSQAQVLEEAVLPEQPRLHLITEGSTALMATTRKPRWWHTPIWRMTAAAAAALITVLGFFAFERVAHYRVKSHQEEQLHLTVSAPKAVPAGAPWSFTVQAKNLNGKTTDCRVRWQAFGDNNALLTAGESATYGGNITVALPANLEVPNRIEVLGSTADDEVRQVFELSTANASPLVHVSTDRPVYRPGEKVFVRTVVLDRVTRLPLKQTTGMTAKLLDAKGASVGSNYDRAAPAGVGSFVLTIPKDSAGGVHKVEIGSHTGLFAAQTAEVVVRAFRNPRLAKDIVLDRKSYAPGARGSAEVLATRLGDDSPAAAATARGALILDGEEVWHESRNLGANGRATFRFQIPKDVDQGAARFVATITDGGTVETEVEPFVVPTGKVHVAAYPEGGELVANVENSVYLECTDTLGRAIDTAGEVVDDRERRVARFLTAHQGRTRLSFVPEAGQSYKVRLAGKTTTFELPEVQKEGIAMRLVDDDIQAGSALRVNVAGRGNGPWLLGVFCRGVLVGQTTLRGNDRGELQTTSEVQLPDTASGVLRTTIFDRNLTPIAERLVRRRAQHRLNVELTAKSSELLPGDRQSVTVQTSDENGRATQAVVGLRCTDMGALAMGSEPRINLENHAAFFGDVQQLEDLGDFFLDSDTSAHNVDLLLGTRGWRRFVWRNDAQAKAAIADAGDVGKGILAREGFSQTPQVSSNLEAANAGAAQLHGVEYRAGRQLKTVTSIAIALLILLLLTEGLCAWMRSGNFKGNPVLRGTTALAGAALLMLLVVAVQPSMLGGGMAPTADSAMPLDDFDGEGRFVQWGSPPRVPEEPTHLSLESAFDSDQWNSAVGLAGGAGGGNTSDPAASPMAGAFFNDGDEGDIRARTGMLFFDEFDESVLSNVAQDPGAPTQLPFDLGASGWVDSELHWRPSAKPDMRHYARIWRQRQYSHRHKPSDERQDFQPTVFWHTLAVTNDQGQATASFDTSDAVTTWKVEADAHVAKGDTGRIGSGQTTFTTQLPLTIEPKLPNEVSAGDRLLIPIAAVLKDARIPEVKLTTRLGKGLTLGADAPKTITLDNTNSDAGRGRALLPIEVGAEVGQATIEIEARAGRFVDRIRHVVQIAPRGFPHRRSAGGRITAAQPSEWQLVIPSQAVAGSGHATLKVYPSPIAALTEGLEGILREPHGCFEQASSSNYPNTLVLNLLEANGDDVPMVAARARQLLPKGYAKITGYECDKKGYEWFGSDPGHEALTAYGLLQFHDMANVYDVDMEMVDRTKQWLLNRRDGKGNYPHPSVDHHSFGGRSPTITNAYVTYALLQAGTPASELKVEIDALVARKDIDDPYELALIACALNQTERTEAAQVRKRLASLQAEDGSLPGAKSSITMSGGRDLLVESTGFAVLAWLADPQFAGNVHQAVEFLQSARNGRGTFGATQATIVALRALTEYAKVNRAMRTDGVVRIYEADKLVTEQPFEKSDNGAMTFDLWDKLAAGEHTLRIEVEGGGESPLPWAGEVHYHAETPANDSDATVGITASLRDTTVREGLTVALDIVVENRSAEEIPTPIAIVGLPAGLDLPTKILEDLLDAEAFAFWELRGRELVLYWRKMDPGQRHELTFDLTARVPGTSSGPASRSYLYYTPDQKHWAAPLTVEVEAAQ